MDDKNLAIIGITILGIAGIIVSYFTKMTPEMVISNCVSAIAGMATGIKLGRK